MSLDGMSLKEARKLLDSIKEKLELVLSKNRDSEIITNGNSHEKNGNSTIIHNQNGDSKKENNDSQQPKEDGKKEKYSIVKHNYASTFNYMSFKTSI